MIAEDRESMIVLERKQRRRGQSESAVLSALELDILAVLVPRENTWSSGTKEC